MTDKIINLPLDDNYRIVAISDIHGHLDVFNALIEQAQLQPNDHLIIIGDFINKGPESLFTLRKMMALTQRPNTYILKGNHEYFICHYLYDAPNNERFLSYLQENHFETILHDTCRHGGYDLYACKDLPSLIHWQMTHYKAELDFINTLPVIAFGDGLTFVHGGYSPEIDIENEEGKLLKFDDYNNLSDVNLGPVIVGHWPTANLRNNRNTNIPFFNNEKNIITIDGGIGVKSSGEMNALIIEKKNGELKTHYLQANHFEKRRIKESYHFETEDRIFVNYPHFDIEVIEKGELMTKCRHCQSGKELSIFNSLLETIDGKPQVITTYINHFLNLDIGEEVELVMAYDDCALVKYDGEFGWILRRQI